MRAKLGISGGVLKWTAIVLMAIDHIGACILENFMMDAWGTSPAGSYFLGSWEKIYAIDKVLRAIGRPAFPIFCFLLVEGFLHTHDVKKYAARLGIFALASEVPFELALWNQASDWRHQNVFFTLLIGLLAIWMIRSQEERLYGFLQGTASRRELPGILFSALACAAAVAGGAWLAETIGTDYGDFGVLFIVALYLSHRWRFLQCLTGAALCAWERTAPLAFLLIYFYNGTRGRQPRWFFYWFYPAHLFLYYLIGAWVIPAAIGVLR